MTGPCELAKHARRMTGPSANSASSHSKLGHVSAATLRTAVMQARESMTPGTSAGVAETAGVEEADFLTGAAICLLRCERLKLHS